MKRKIKKYADEGFVTDDDEINRAVRVGQKPDVEEMKRGIASGTPTDLPSARELQSSKAAEVKMPRAKPRAKAEDEGQAERRMAAIGDKYKENKASSQSFPTSVGMESGSAAMKRGRASTDGSGSSPLDKYMRDKETRATRDKRKMDLAVERVKAGVGYKSGGSASSRADGCAIRGKTRGKMY